MDNLIEKNVLHTTQHTTTTGPVAQWRRNLTSSQGILGSSLGRVDILLHIIVLIISLSNMSNKKLDVELPTGPVAKFKRHKTSN